MKATGTAEMATVVQVNFMVFIFFGQFVMHITNGEQMNTGGDKGHHGKHHQRQAVDIPVERHTQPAETGQFVVRSCCVLFRKRFVTGRFRMFGMIIVLAVTVVLAVSGPAMLGPMCGGLPVMAGVKQAEAGVRSPNEQGRQAADESNRNTTDSRKRGPFVQPVRKS